MGGDAQIEADGVTLAGRIASWRWATAKPTTTLNTNPAPHPQPPHPTAAAERHRHRLLQHYAHYTYYAAATVLIDIEASRSHFEALINNMNNPQPSAPSLGSLNGAAPSEGGGDLMGGTKPV